jgi:farnesyl-diphosphate farnesyltransferase
MYKRKLRQKPQHPKDDRYKTPTAKTCFKFLHKTGRSFSPVVKDLHPELSLPVCIFYLTLRGLDTIEDDTSIPLEIKEPLLREFKDYLDIDGWNYTGNRPEEKDRELLVQFDNVIVEFRKMKPVYADIVRDVTGRMGGGMADYARKADLGIVNVDSIAEYDLYCWYVAGLVGEGLTRLFVEAGLADTVLIEQGLYKPMGLFLQKTNIIRDIREDRDDGRRFWPEEIISKHVANFDKLLELENRGDAVACSSEMILDALRHVCDCLTYLAGLREQSVFNFCAIPQCMAIATLELCFCNPELFDQRLKIAKGDALRLVLEASQGMESVCYVFCRYVGRIKRKIQPDDACYLRVRDASEEVCIVFLGHG